MGYPFEPNPHHINVTMTLRPDLNGSYQPWTRLKAQIHSYIIFVLFDYEWQHYIITIIYITAYYMLINHYYGTLSIIHLGIGAFGPKVESGWLIRSGLWIQDLTWAQLSRRYIKRVHNQIFQVKSQIHFFSFCLIPQLSGLGLNTTHISREEAHTCAKLTHKCEKNVISRNQSSSS